MKTKAKPKLLPRDLLAELNFKRKLEANWKAAVSGKIVGADELQQIESRFIVQKKKVDELLFVFNNRNRNKIMDMCSGKSTKARKTFGSVLVQRSSSLPLYQL